MLACEKGVPEGFVWKGIGKLYDTKPSSTSRPFLRLAGTPTVTNNHAAATWNRRDLQAAAAGDGSKPSHQKLTQTSHRHS